MSYKATRRFQASAFLIVLLALAISIFQFTTITKKTAKFDFRPGMHAFDNLKFINKVQIEMSSENAETAQSDIARLIKEKGKRSIRKQDSGAYGSYIFIAMERDLQEIIDELREYGSINSQIEQVDTSLVNLDVSSESEKLRSYESELKELSAVRLPTEQQNRRKNELHNLIKSTRQNLDKLHETDSVLLYVTLSPQKDKGGYLGLAKSFILLFLKWLGIFTLGFILTFLAVMLLNTILDTMGIKVRSLSATNYGSYQNYQGYLSRGSKKGSRKVKRVYKDNRPSPQEEKKD